MIQLGDHIIEQTGNKELNKYGKNPQTNMKIGTEIKKKHIGHKYL